MRRDYGRGIATGATIRAALRATGSRRPKRLLLAVPIGPTDGLAVFRREAGEVVYLENYEIFEAIGLQRRSCSAVRR